MEEPLLKKEEADVVGRQRYIPNDVVTDLILDKLPRKSLIRFQCVCRDWHSWIRTNKLYHGRPKVLVFASQQRFFLYVALGIYLFIVTIIALRFPHAPEWIYPSSIPVCCLACLILLFKTERLEFILANCHDNNSYFDTNITSRIKSIWSVDSLLGRVRFLGSCDGLVALACGSDIYLTNPTTRFFIKVLELRILLHILDNENIVVSGLSRHYPIGDYKVVLIVRNGSNPGHPDDAFAIVGSCKTKEWREVPFPFHQRTSAKHALDFRGTLHFMVSNSLNNNDDINKCELSTIVYFDPTRDEFRTLPAPEPMDGRECNYVYGLGVIDECLCMGRRKYLGNLRRMEVLVMKEYDVKESWVTAFDVPELVGIDFGFVELQFYSVDENQREVIIIHSTQRTGNTIFKYDRQTNETRTSFFSLEKNKEVFDKPFMYFESFDHPPQGLAWKRNHHRRLARKIHWLQLP